ncbi:hypothetical protein [Gilvimarinus sp. DA14]|uniref:hypothetical protein n=1 Tax=Gilvimarinus sp. DA14 TaxID=2956798 RepID=UPI0020B6727C|nr:hypothetical protein [Gilvimarinus sp. DA14]UTF59298.1 hypothetical protein NHM04_12525 [Gilvimarinus sp. DA14]
MSYKAWFLTGLVIALGGCGAERDEPFDPDTPVEEDPDAVRINVTKVIDGQQPLLDIDGERQILVFREQEEYWLFLDRYTDTLPANEPDFEDGQVVLIDLGERDNSQCEESLSLTTVIGEEYGDRGARLRLSYDLTESVEDDTCSDAEAELLRPYYFYYISTRRQLVVSEALSE